MTLESKENYPRHTKTVQNSLGFMPEVKPLHKPRGDLVLCALKMHNTPGALYRYAPGGVYIQIMLLEHIELRILPQIIHAPGAAVPGASAPGA